MRRDTIAAFTVIFLATCATAPPAQERPEHPRCESYRALERRAKEAGQAFRPPIVVTRVEPQYPIQLQNQRVVGVVALVGCISRDGLIEDVQVVQTPHDELTTASVAAFLKWRFTPATVGGVAEPMSTTFRFDFRAR